MKTSTSQLICIFLLAGMYALFVAGCEKTHSGGDSTQRGKYGYICDDSTSKPIAGVTIIGYNCDDYQDYVGCVGLSLEYDREVTDANGYFQLVYDPNAYWVYIMGYEIIRNDFANHIYYVRHW